MTTNGGKERSPEKKGRPIPLTTWPESIPTEHEDYFISVSVGNSNLHWCLHHGAQQGYSPKTFWRTSHFDPEEMTGSATECLGSHLAPTAIDWVFGGRDVPATKETALEHLKTRRMAAITVLVVSSNNEQAEWVSYMFGDIPSRVYMMKGDDFFGKERHGRYEGMGVDRLCCLRGATDMFGYPTLVIDGGTAMTFTAVNSEPYILGGTIGPGILLQLNALSEYASALPRIEESRMQKMLLDAEKKGEPINTFCKDTREQMLANVAISVANSLHDHIRRFVDILKTEDQENWKEEDGVHVVLCGGDAQTLQLLLPPTVNTVLGMEPELPPMEVHVSPWLCHFGVVEVIKEQISYVENDEVYENDLTLLGQRVAKEFKQFDEFGENIYRGIVVAVSRDDKTQSVFYRVLYDDNDTEDFSEVELFNALNLYVEEGERDTRNENTIAPVRGRVVAPLIDKKAGAKAAAVRLEMTSTAVKNMLEKKASETLSAKSPRINMPSRPPPQAAPARPSPPAVAAPPLAAEPAAVEPPAAEEASIPTAAKSTTKRSSPPPDEPAPAKKAKTAKKKKKGGDFVGHRVAKYFESGDGLALFFGEVDRYDESSKFWHITYDDDDQEEMDKPGLREALKLYEENKDEDPKNQD